MFEIRNIWHFKKQFQGDQKDPYHQEEEIETCLLSAELDDIAQ
jgi:hypothetical protein